MKIGIDDWKRFTIGVFCIPLSVYLFYSLYYDWWGVPPVFFFILTVFTGGMAFANSIYYEKEITTSC